MNAQEYYHHVIDHLKNLQLKTFSVFNDYTGMLWIGRILGRPK